MSVAGSASSLVSSSTTTASWLLRAAHLPATRLLVTLRRSFIGRSETQRKTVAALGLRRVNHTVVRRDGPATWGAVRKIIHMVEVERVPAEAAEARCAAKDGKAPSPHL